MWRSSIGNDKHPLREGVFIVYFPIDKHHPKKATSTKELLYLLVNIKFDIFLSSVNF